MLCKLVAETIVANCCVNLACCNSSRKSRAHIKDGLKRNENGAVMKWTNCNEKFYTATKINTHEAPVIRTPLVYSRCEVFFPLLLHAFPS